MCLRLVGNCVCCFFLTLCSGCQLGLKLLCSLIFAFLGILIILASIIYFSWFYNKPASSTTVADSAKALATDTPAVVKGFLHKLIDTI